LAVLLRWVLDAVMGDTLPLVTLFGAVVAAAVWLGGYRVAILVANHTVLTRKDGSECPIDDSAAPIRDEQGHVSGCERPVAGRTRAPRRYR
jgi:ribosomal protein L14